MALGVRISLDAKILFDIGSDYTGQSLMVSNVNLSPGLSPNTPSNHDYQGRFREPIKVKDMTLAIDACEPVRVRPSLVKSTREVYQEAPEDLYCAERDATVVYEWLSRKGTKSAHFYITQTFVLLYLFSIFPSFNTH